MTAIFAAWKASDTSIYKRAKVCKPKHLCSECKDTWIDKDKHLCSPCRLSINRKKQKSKLLAKRDLLRKERPIRFCEDCKTEIGPEFPASRKLCAPCGCKRNSKRAKAFGKKSRADNKPQRNKWMRNKNIFIVGVNMDRRQALLSNGEIVPITNLVFNDDDEALDATPTAFMCGVSSDYRVALMSEFNHEGQHV